MKNDVHKTQDDFKIPWILFYNKEDKTWNKIWINSSHDIVILINILYGYLPDYQLDLYQSDKDFFGKMNKYVDK